MSTTKPTVYMYVILKQQKVRVAPGRDGWRTIEQVVFRTDLREDLLLQATVVIDLLGRKLVKNRNDWPQAATIVHYLDKYRDSVSMCLARLGLSRGQRTLAHDRKNAE